MLVRSEQESSRVHPSLTVAPPPLDDPSLYFSRELSWLAFNERVLEEGLDERHPLLERVKFVAIYGTNLDEYFMVRVAGLKQQLDADVHARSVDGRLPAEQLRAISARLRPSLERQQQLLRDVLLPELARNGIKILRYDALSEAAREELRRTFYERVFPVLTPLAVDRTHPFPYISNLSLSLGVEIRDETSHGPVEHFARVKVPSSLPRFVPIPSPWGESHFVLLEDVIAHNLDALFPGVEVVRSYCFRVTRDADLDIQEDEADDLISAIESELRKRRFGEPVRLEVEAAMPRAMRSLLLEELELEEQDLYAVDGPLAVSGFWTIASLDRPELRDPSFTPVVPRRVHGAADMFEAIREGDILLHHPYDSFDPVVQLLEAAAEDPRVLAIKQTLYRTSGTSPVVSALMRAAENGKQVAALIELKARFDEENNILWARKLERVGAHVIYSVPGLKVHAKVTLIVRDEPEGIRRYVHFGTGNYNEKTARIYTDLSLLTCRPDLGADATRLFNSLTGFTRAAKYGRLLVAPRELRARFLEMIDREIEHRKAGRAAGIVAKLNAISDETIVEALYRASQAGVPIELLVRGLCELRPGVPGVSDTIRVRSLVGRFLEHSRIFVFENGGEREVYMGSADWMGRNLDRRVEVIVPVLCPELRDRVTDEILGTLMRDDAQTRWLQSDGTYVRRIPPGGPAHSAQLEFLAAGRSAARETR